jgi:hypothetical protein
VLNSAGRASASDGAGAAAQDILRHCLRQSTRVYGWGSVEDLASLTPDEPLPQEDLVALGNQRLKGGPAIAHPSVLPALGAALRGARPSHRHALGFVRQAVDRRKQKLESLHAPFRTSHVEFRTSHFEFRISNSFFRAASR